VATGKRLGRGLETLLGRIGSGSFSEPVAVSSDEEKTMSGSNKIDIMRIVPNPFQPRKVFDETELEELAQSLDVHGLMQPITVRQVDQQYQIIAGERRFRAALRLGWSEIPAIVLTADDQKMAELALTENIQRKDLNDIEKAMSFANYLEIYGGTQNELAKRLGIDHSTLSNLLRLLKLPVQLQEAVCQESLSAGHIRALFSLPELEQIEVAAKIQAEGWSVRTTERFVQELRKNPETAWNVVDQDGETKAVFKQSEQVLQLEELFRHYLGGMKVKLVQTNEKGKGKLVVSFANHAEFEHLYAAICKPQRAAG
jgi:ParB family chromosome partitioning protein